MAQTSGGVLSIDYPRWASEALAAPLSVAFGYSWEQFWNTMNNSPYISPYEAMRILLFQAPNSILDSRFTY